MSKKPTASNTASRAVLREQYDQQKSLEQALAHVHSELGAASMTKKSASYWWKQFGDGKRTLGSSTPYRERQKAADPQYLKNQRALQFSLWQKGWYPRVLASNGRFFIALVKNSAVIIDSFHKEQRELVFDASPVQAKDPKFPAAAFVAKNLRLVQLVNDGALLMKLVYGKHPNIKQVAVLARLDLRTTTASALSIIEVPGFVQKVEPTDNPATFFCYSYGYNGSLPPSAVLLKIHADGALSVGPQIELPASFYTYFCMYKAGTIYSFDKVPNSGHCTPKKLRAYSLESQTTSVQALEFPSNASFSEYELVRSPGGCLMQVRNYNTQFTSIFEFRLDSFEWRDSGVRLLEDIRFMTTAERVLVLVTLPRQGKNTWSFYRFAHHRAKKLLDLTWSAVVRRDEQEPGFAAKELEKLPPYLALRCPWIPVEKKGQKRLLEPVEDDEQAAGPSGLLPKHPKADDEADE